MLISFYINSLLLISFTLINNVQLVTSHITTVSKYMQKSTILIKNTLDKYKRAYQVLEFYLISKINRFEKNLLPEQIKELTEYAELRKSPASPLPSILYASKAQFSGRKWSTNEPLRYES